jgi:hypothetical protein
MIDDKRDVFEPVQPYDHIKRTSIAVVNRANLSPETCFCHSLAVESIASKWRSVEGLVWPHEGAVLDPRSPSSRHRDKFRGVDWNDCYSAECSGLRQHSAAGKASRTLQEVRLGLKR